MLLKQEAITDLLRPGQPLLSVEFFPPKTEEEVGKLEQAAQQISVLGPDFVSVTYGAGGSTRDRSARVSQIMKNEVGLRVMPHLTCVGSSRQELGEIVDGFYAEGYRNIMTLRGDPPRDQANFVVPEGGFAHASDLVAFIKDRQPEMCLGVAGYPEKHPEAPSMDRDLDHLKIKVDAGASFITTQLFFENRHYYDFVERARAKGIDLPIIPGLMPVLSLSQIKRITQMCGSALPAELEAKLEAAPDKASVKAIGAEWAQAQLLDLLEHDIPGVHLYALNKADVALELMKSFRQATAA